MEDIIQILDDHIAVLPNPAQAHTERETDSGLEEPVEQESDNGSESQEVDVVATSVTDEEEIIVVDPTTIETYSEADVQIPARLTFDKPERDVHGQKERVAPNENENNNNQEEEKAILELPTSRQLSPLPTSKQLLLHQVPITFPVPGNLMESIDSLMYINEALISLVEDLPADALVDATPLHRVNSYQARTAVILTFDTVVTRNRVLRAFREGKTNYTCKGGTDFYYFTEIPRRSRVRRQTHTEDELQEMRNEARNSREERPNSKTKTSSKEKPKAVTLAS